MLPIIKMTDLNLENKRLLIRVDFNVPLQDGQITSDVRIKAALPTIEYALNAGAKIMLVSHLGRPTEGQFDQALSLAPVANRLSQLLDHPVYLAQQWLDGVKMTKGEIVLCENVRFLAGEKANDKQLAKKLASLCDIFVMDAFGTAHRAEASTYGVAEYAPIACAGPLLVAELAALQRAMEQPTRPLLAIVGGSKVSSKLAVLESLLDRVDQLIVGGGIANTFMAAAGLDVGQSLYEPDMLDIAKRLMAKAEQRGAIIPLPVDVIVGMELATDAKATIKNASSIANSDRIFDIGPRTAEQFVQLIQQAGTILWNGPVGVFEYLQFSQGTQVIANAIAASPAFSIAGGGDTLAAIEKYGITQQISYISTGGGAFLEFIEGKKLPAVSILEIKAQQRQGNAPVFTVDQQ